MEKQNFYYENYEIKISHKKIKNIILKIKKDQSIELSVPNRIKHRDIYHFLEQKKLWIANTLEKYRAVNTNDFYYLGQKFEIDFKHHNSRILRTEQVGSKFIFYLHEGVPIKTKERLLNKFLEQQLYEIVKEFFEKWEKSLGISKNSLVIKKMKGKWGYCQTQNHDICLNFELIKKDIRFIEYVVLHELCHILVPNHGPEFKNLLNLHMPEWKKIDKKFSI